MKRQRAVIGFPPTAALLLTACAFAGGAAAASLSKNEYRMEHDNAQAAKASWVAARSEARLSRASVDNGMYSRQAISERKEAREDNAAALFAAAKERCDALSGDAKAGCVGDAKKKFGKL